MVWIFIHIYYLIEFDNKLLVMLQWGWHYFTSQRGARLITGDDSIPALSDLVLKEMSAQNLSATENAEMAKV